jgi:crotonobetainyl-CoA:carnitine CoA-transferase CaiB-like acyl-CoA transferase
MLQHIERRGGSPVPLIGPVAKLSETPAKIYNPPPTLGEQTRVILMQELGYSAQEIDELLLKKVI